MSKYGKKAIINVQNTEDHRCFEYSVIAALHPAKDNPQRTSSYEQYMGQLKECNPSMTIVDIPKFETANKLSISVYTMAQDGVIVYPLYMSKKRSLNPINLLLIEGEDNNHYTYIKDYNRLMRKPNESNTKVFCPHCCYGFCTDRNRK